MTSDVERLRKQIKELRADLAKLGVLARDAANEKVQQAEESLQGCLDEGRERIDECEDRVTDYIRAKPFQSVLIAIGAGFLLSLFLRRR